MDKIICQRTLDGCPPALYYRLLLSFARQSEPSGRRGLLWLNLDGNGSGVFRNST